MKDVRVHEISIGVATKRLGSMGRLLLHDVGRGSESAIKLLTFWSGAQWRINDDRILEALYDNGDSRWEGNRIVVKGVMPETVISAVVGRRLGDVVEGSTQGDAIIESGMQMPFRPEGWTTITVSSPEVRLRDVEVATIDRAMGPARRLAWWVIWAWIDMFLDRKHERPAEFVDLVLEAVLVCISILGATMLVGLGTFLPLRLMPADQVQFVRHGLLLMAIPALWMMTGLLVHFDASLRLARRKRMKRERTSKPDDHGRK